MEDIYFTSFDSPYGPIYVYWRSVSGMPKIVRVCISEAIRLEYIGKKNVYFKKRSCTEIDGVIDTMQSYFSGKVISLNLDVLDLSLLPAFQKSVLLAQANIARGDTNTYKDLAEKIGKPKSFRAAGSALANNPFPIIIPCHRTIKSDGTIGEYQGGKEMKYKLLRMEGAKIKDIAK